MSSVSREVSPFFSYAQKLKEECVDEVSKREAAQKFCKHFHLSVAAQDENVSKQLRSGIKIVPKSVDGYFKMLLALSSLEEMEIMQEIGLHNSSDASILEVLLSTKPRTKAAEKKQKQMILALIKKCPQNMLCTKNLISLAINNYRSDFLRALFSTYPEATLQILNQDEVRADLFGVVVSRALTSREAAEGRKALTRCLLEKCPKQFVLSDDSIKSAAIAKNTQFLHAVFTRYKEETSLDIVEDYIKAHELTQDQHEQMKLLIPYMYGIKNEKKVSNYFQNAYATLPHCFLSTDVLKTDGIKIAYFLTNYHMKEVQGGHPNFHQEISRFLRMAKLSEDGKNAFVEQLKAENRLPQELATSFTEVQKELTKLKIGPAFELALMLTYEKPIIQGLFAANLAAADSSVVPGHDQWEAVLEGRTIGVIHEKKFAEGTFKDAFSGAVIDTAARVNEAIQPVFATFGPAVKLHPKNEGGIESFNREIDVYRDLQAMDPETPNVVKLYSARKAAPGQLDQSGMVVQFCKGSFEEHTTISEDNRTFTLQKKLVDGLAGVLEGLVFMNKRYIHSDIKPDNMMYLEENGTFSGRVADLGLAFKKKEAIPAENCLGQSDNRTYGTPTFTAPEARNPNLFLTAERTEEVEEVLEKNAKALEKLEAWAFGVSMYKIFFGRAFPSCIMFADERTIVDRPSDEFAASYDAALKAPVNALCDKIDSGQELSDKEKASMVVYTFLSSILQINPESRLTLTEALPKMREAVRLLHHLDEPNVWDAYWNRGEVPPEAALPASLPLSSTPTTT